MSSEEMQVNPQRAKQLVENLQHVAEQVRSANSAGRNVSSSRQSLTRVSLFPPSIHLLSTSCHTPDHLLTNFLPY